MATTAEVADISRFDEALAAVRSDEHGVQSSAWVIASHVDGKPDLIDIVEYKVGADATLESFHSQLQDDQVMYCLVRLTTTIDMSTTIKFVYVHWLGEKISMMKKGQFGVVHGSVQERFSPYHLMIETGNLEDLAEDQILAKLDESSGMKDKVIADITGRQVRGFTQHGTQAPTRASAKITTPHGASIPFNDDVTAAIGEVRNDASPLTWVLVGYEDNNINNPLGLIAKGEGEMSAMLDHLKDDIVLYGLYRITDVIDNIPTVKFVHIAWIGENVKPMTKAKVSAHRGSVEDIFSPAHVTLFTSDENDLSQENILDKVMAGSGSKSFVK